MFDIFEILDHASCSLTVVDVGAASMGPTADPYYALSARPNVKIVGFEPNTDACERRNAEGKPNHLYLPFFIADGARHRFHMCQNPLTSSLFEPNHALLARFQNMALPVTGVSEVETHRLDDIPEIGDCDLLKLDIQGAELLAINGASELLAKTMVVHTEVEFIPMYKDQPLFGDIDVRLREMGFLLHKFEGVFGRQMKPLVVKNDPFSPLSQIVFAEAAVYVRNFMDFSLLEPRKLINLACILHAIYKSYDLCAQALEAADRKCGTSLYKRYLERLTGRKP